MIHVNLFTFFDSLEDELILICFLNLRMCLDAQAYETVNYYYKSLNFYMKYVPYVSVLTGAWAPTKKQSLSTSFWKTWLIEEQNSVLLD